jgi:hypothetical protein
LKTVTKWLEFDLICGKDIKNTPFYEKAGPRRTKKCPLTGHFIPGYFHPIYSLQVDL